MGIDNYMTITEAAHRWGISSYKLKKIISDSAYIQEDINNKFLKPFQLPQSSRVHWIIHVRAMERWFGPEPMNITKKTTSTVY